MADVDDVEGFLESDLTAEDIDPSLSNKCDVGNTSTLSDTAASTGSAHDDTTDDPELEAIKARVREMEQEQLKLKQMQDEVEKQLMTTGSNQPKQFPTQEEKMEADQRLHFKANISIYFCLEVFGPNLYCWIFNSKILNCRSQY